MKFFYSIVWLLSMSTAKANENGYNPELWVFQWLGSEGAEKLREWDIHVSDIPLILQWATDFLLGIAGTISVLFIIIGAYKIAFWSLTKNTQEWKDTIIMALWGFAVAVLSWFIVRFIIDSFI